MDFQQSSQPIAQILQALCFWASINLSLQGHWPAILISQNTESCWRILPRLPTARRVLSKRGWRPSSRSLEHSPLHLLKARRDWALAIQLRGWAHHYCANKSKLIDIHIPGCDLFPLEITWNRTTRNACHHGIFSVTSHLQEEETIPTRTKPELMAECSPLSFLALLLMCCGALGKTLKFLVISTSLCISVK